MGLFNKAKGGSLPYPGMCAICGSSYKDALDVGFDFSSNRNQDSRLGAILLCTDCFHSAAEVMGYVQDAKVTVMIQEAVAEVFQDESQRVSDQLQKLIATHIRKIEDDTVELSILVHRIVSGNYHDPEPADEPPVDETLDLFELSTFDPEHSGVSGG